MTSAMLFGLGSDGTVGAAKAAMKIAADAGEVQGYFVYDSKIGSLPHLWFAQDPIAHRGWYNKQISLASTTHAF